MVSDEKFAVIFVPFIGKVFFSPGTRILLGIRVLGWGRVEDAYSSPIQARRGSFSSYSSGNLVRFLE